MGDLKILFPKKTTVNIAGQEFAIGGLTAGTAVFFANLVATTVKKWGVIAGTETMISLCEEEDLVELFRSLLNCDLEFARANFDLSVLMQILQYTYEQNPVLGKMLGTLAQRWTPVSPVINS